MKYTKQMANHLDLMLNDLMEMEKILWEDIVSYSEDKLSLEAGMFSSRRYFTISTAIYIEAITIGTESASTLTRVIKSENIKKKEANIVLKNILTQIPNNRTSENIDRRSFADRVKSGLNSISKVTGYPFDLSAQNSEWETFNKAIRIRDRIVHPKTLDDLKISDFDLLQVITAGTWYKKNLYFVCTGKN